MDHGVWCGVVWWSWLSRAVRRTATQVGLLIGGLVPGGLRSNSLKLPAAAGAQVLSWRSLARRTRDGREVQPRRPKGCVSTLALACLCPCHSKRSRPSTPRGLGVGEAPLERWTGVTVGRTRALPSTPRGLGVGETPLERWTGVTVGRTRAFGPIATPSQRQLSITCKTPRLTLGC